MPTSRAKKCALCPNLCCSNATHCQSCSHIVAQQKPKTYKRRERNSWSAMRYRCLNPKHEAYGRYGGAGITICERWMKFENFYADMGPRPEGMTLDRYPNRNGNYEPGNCRWATWKEQANNKRQSQNRKNVAGQRFGMLLVLEFVGKNEDRRCLWKCRCDCGEIITRSFHSIQVALKHGVVPNCGCRQWANLSQRMKTNNPMRPKAVAAYLGKLTNGKSDQ